MQIPVGPAPIIRIVSSEVISFIRARPVAGREYVADKQRLTVADIIGDFIKPLVGERHAHILGLTAIDAAAKRPAAVSVSAVVYKAVTAEEAVAAEGLDVDRDAVALFDPDLPRCLLRRRRRPFHDPTVIPTTGAGTLPVLDVQVACADTRERDLDYCVPLVKELRLWFFDKAEAALLQI